MLPDRQPGSIARLAVPHRSRNAANVGGSQPGRPARVRSHTCPRRLSQEPGRHNEGTNGERVKLLTLSPADRDPEGHRSVAFAVLSEASRVWRPTIRSSAREW
jgi:hypothetical protein